MPWLVDSLVIVRFYVINKMRDVLIINYQLILYQEKFVQKEKKGNSCFFLDIFWKKIEKCMALFFFQQIISVDA